MPAVVISNADATSTVRDVIAQLPLLCQGYYLPAFNQLNDKAQRYFAAKHAEEEFRAMISSGRTPNSINSVKTPTLQVSAEYANAEKAKTRAYQEIENYTREVRSAFLDKFARAKKEEADYYFSKYLSASAQIQAISEANKKIADGLLSSHNVKTITSLPESVQKALQDITSGGGVGYAQHIIEIARLRSISAYERTKSKKQIKAQADEKMSGTDGMVDEKTLEKSVENVLKRKEQSRRDKQKNDKSKINKNSKKKRKTAPGGSPSNAKSSKKPRKS